MMQGSNKEQFVEAFGAAGYRLTRQREKIFEYLTSLDGVHPSARQVYENLKGQGAEISVATVYNTLGALVRLGAIKVIEFESLDNRYELNVEPHINLICTSCGDIRDFHTGALIHAGCAMDEMNFSVRDFRLEYYGRCTDCLS
ncbi:Fur family transcriptional regulator [Candidatus Moduliflexota bacterium]